MCLIVYNPTGAELPMNEIRIAFANNNDGFGIMWPENGRVKSVRGLFNFKEISDLIKARKGKPYAFHMRWRTVGAIGVDQCHPFKTLNVDEGESQDLYMMHNGTFSGLSDKVKSDTELFNECVTQYLSKKSPEVIDELIKTEIDSSVSSANKVLFMDGSGKTFIAGEKRGLWISSVWYSNLYSFYATKNIRTNQEIIMSIVYGSALQRRVSINHQSVQANYNTAIKMMPQPRGKSIKKGLKNRSSQSTLPPPRRDAPVVVQKFSTQKTAQPRGYNSDESFEFNFGLFDSEPDEEVVYDIGMSIVSEDDAIVFDATTDDDIDFGPEESRKGVYLNADYNQTQKFLASQNNAGSFQDKVNKNAETLMSVQTSSSRRSERKLRKIKRKLDKLTPEGKRKFASTLSTNTIKALNESYYGRNYEKSTRQNGKSVRHVVYSHKREI